ncbi:MAG: cation:proton antiporter [Thermoplasmata archaeon]|nr:cation:proton antiporter [Thermoplasmata archaeon]
MTDATTSFLIALFLLIALAVLVGEVFTRFGQVALVGQLLVGVVLGPTLLGPFLGISGTTASFGGIQTLATFFVLLMAGLSVSPEQIWDTGLSAVLLGIAIFLVPFLGGAAVVFVLYPGLAPTTQLFVALTVSITALPVLAIMLREFGLMKTRFGTFLLNASVINELSAVTAFAILLSVSTSTAGTFKAIAISIATVALFLTTVLAIHVALRAFRQVRLWDRLVVWFRESWRSREAGFALLITIGLGAALYSQFLGLTFVVGAFYAGLLVTPESAGSKEHRSLTYLFEAVTWGFFIPLFFALVGFNTNFRSLFSTPLAVLLFGALCLFCLMVKIGMGALVTRSLRWSRQESLAAGWLVSSRGAVELAMATILLGLGIFSQQIFTIVAGVGLVTTFLSPIGARPFIRQVTLERRAAEEAARQPPVGSSLPPRSLLPEDDASLN